MNLTPSRILKIGVIHSHVKTSEDYFDPFRIIMNEKFNSKIFRDISKIDVEYFEVPRINDRIKHSMEFINNEFQSDVIIKSYTIISRLLSVILISLSLIISDYWQKLLLSSLYPSAATGHNLPKKD